MINETILDLAIIGLRTQHVEIYSSCAPFVDPTKKGKICYGYAAKFCNLRDGWNGRIQITEPVFGYDPVVIKKEVIARCIDWLNKRI